MEGTSFTPLSATYVLAKAQDIIDQIEAERDNARNKEIMGWLVEHPFKPRSLWAWLRRVPPEPSTREDAIQDLNRGFAFTMSRVLCGKQYAAACDVRRLARAAINRSGETAVVHLSAADAAVIYA